MERNENNILLCAETAWFPLYKAYTAIAQAYDIEFVMLSMEPEEEIYFNTDHSGIYFPDKYIVRMDDEDFITPSGIRLGEKIEHGETFASIKGLLMRFEDVGYKARSLKASPVWWKTMGSIFINSLTPTNKIMESEVLTYESFCIMQLYGRPE